MSTGERTKGQNRLRTLAKQVLDRSEYVLLRKAWTSFVRTKSVGTLCSDLVIILNCPEKIGLLAEVKQLLPKHMHSEFLHQCRYYLSMALKQKLDRVPRSSKYLQNPEQYGANRKRVVLKERESEDTGGPNLRATSKIATMKHRHSNNDKKKTCSVSSNATDKRSKSINSKAASDAKFDDTTERKSSDPNPIKELDCLSVTLERSKDQDFGFRLLGKLPSGPLGMVVHKVFINSPADEQGICVGDRIICVNSFSFDRMPKEVTKQIKTAKTLRLTILPKQKYVDRASCVTMVSDDGNSVKEVIVHADDNGCLGCSIRGGSDYACDVQIISVKNGSPAKRSGLTKGDFIVKVNNTNTLGLTHVQVVRLIVTAAPPVTFTIRPGKTSNQQLPHHDSGVVSNQHEPGIPTTPLRFCRAENVTPPRSPTYPHIHPPSYSSQLLRASAHCYHGNAESLHLALHAINLNPTPPPPYTTELPSEHRCVAVAEVACQQDRPSLHSTILAPPGSPLSILPLPPFPSPLPPPASPWLLSTPSSHQSLLSSLPPPPSPLSYSHDRVTSSVTAVDEDPEGSNRGIEESTPDGRQSLLCQIQEFNKSSLRSASLVSTHCTGSHTEQVSGTLHGNHGNFDEPTENTGNAGVERNNSDLLSLLNQAIEDRARVLNVTLDSDSEASDSEWEF